MYSPPGSGQTRPALALLLERLARLVDPRVGPALRSQLRSPRTWVWAGVLLVVSLILCALPLFGTLGYEFAFVIAIVGSVAAADLAAALTRRVAASDRRVSPGDQALTPGLELVGSIMLVASSLAVVLLLIPLAVVCANALRVRNCDWIFGFTCYLTMPILSVIWSAGLGVVCALVAGRRRILSNALPYLVIVALIVHSVWKFYSAPAVFSYNPLAGYYSGNLYDEHIELTRTFAWARLHQYLWLGGLLMACAVLIDVPTARLHHSGRRPAGLRLELALCLVTLLGAVAIRLQAGELGFSVAREDVVAALPGRYDSKRFVIHYPVGSDIERDIDLIAEEHDFRLAQLERDLGVTVDGPITSFYFANPDQKARLMGAKRVYMAKPWREEIYLHHAPLPHQVLRHEIAHVVAGTFGDPLFGVSARRVLGIPMFFNVGLIEGIAVAADWPDHFNRAMTPHQSVKAMAEMGYMPPVEKLLSTGFFQFSSARSYTVAGSFVRFLLDRHGPDKLRRLYQSGGDFQAAYGVPLAQLAQSWREMIGAIELGPGDAERVRERFRRGGIFQRPCPHAVADRRSKAGQALAHGDDERAVRLMQEVCEVAPGEPRYKIELARVLAQVGQLPAAAEVYRAIAEDEQAASSALRVTAYLGWAAVAAHDQDWPTVRERLHAARPLPVDDDLARTVEAQIASAEHTGPAGPALREYFWPPDPTAPHDPVAQLGRAAAALAAEPDLGLAHYLVGLNMAGRGAPRQTAAALDRALELGLPGPLFVRECAAQLAAAAYRAGDLTAVERAAGILITTDQPMVTRFLGYDWLERIEWKRTGAVPAKLGPTPTPSVTSR